MRKLPLKFQILLAPTFIIVVIMALIAYTLVRLAEIKQENEAVREWVWICEHAQGAITASQRLDSIARKMRGKGIRNDDLYISYLEQFRSLRDHLDYPALKTRLQATTLAFLRQQKKRIAYSEKLDPETVSRTIQRMLPRLERIYRTFWGKKRAAYVTYYEHVNQVTARVINVALLVLVLTVIAGITLSWMTFLKTRKRLRNLASDAKNICEGRAQLLKEPEHIRDELDELSSCMTQMTHRLVNAVATEKVLLGAENERRRIAMDMHDQTLSDLTHINRALGEIRDVPGETRQQLDALQNDMEDLGNNIRALIDDLHPQALDMLGLGEAIEAWLAKRIRPDSGMEYFTRIDGSAAARLNDLQRLSVYRICLEAVSNILKHAHCSRFEIEAAMRDGKFCLLIEDNGTGMDIDSISRATQGHGLLNMRERANAIGATLNWGSSRFSSGTRVEMLLPLASREPAGD
jgi:signal transduction histidine kinase